MNMMYDARLMGFIRQSKFAHKIGKASFQSEHVAFKYSQLRTTLVSLHIHVCILINHYVSLMKDTEACE